MGLAGLGDLVLHFCWRSTRPGRHDGHDLDSERRVLSAAELEEGPMGFMVEDRRLYAAFLDVMAQTPGLTLLSGESVVAQEVGAQEVTVQLASGRTLRGRVLVGCDGRVALCQLLGPQGPLAGGRAHEIHHQGDGQHAVQHKGEDRAQHRTVGVGGLGNAHHERDVNPSNCNDVHEYLFKK